MWYIWRIQRDVHIPGNIFNIFWQIQRGLHSVGDISNIIYLTNSGRCLHSGQHLQHNLFDKFSEVFKFWATFQTWFIWKIQRSVHILGNIPNIIFWQFQRGGYILGDTPKQWIIQQCSRGRRSKNFETWRMVMEFVWWWCSRGNGVPSLLLLCYSRRR